MGNPQLLGQMASPAGIGAVRGWAACASQDPCPLNLLLSFFSPLSSPSSSPREASAAWRPRSSRRPPSAQRTPGAGLPGDCHLEKAGPSQRSQTSSGGFAYSSQVHGSSIFGTVSSGSHAFRQSVVIPGVENDRRVGMFQGTEVQRQGQAVPVLDRVGLICFSLGPTARCWTTPARTICTWVREAKHTHQHTRIHSHPYVHTHTHTHTHTHSLQAQTHTG